MKSLTRLVLTAGLAGAVAPAMAFVVDGKFGGATEGYTLGFDVSFSLDNGSTIVDGGRLFFGSDTASDGDNYMYFAMPKTFVDNTWGGNKQVDWGSKKASFKDRLNSDVLGKFDTDPTKNQPLVLTTNQGILELQVDYIAGEKKDNPAFFRSAGIATNTEVDIDGNPQDNTNLSKPDNAGFAGDASGVKEIATSIEFNINRILASSDPTIADDVPNSTKGGKTVEGLLLNSPKVNPDYSCDASLTGEQAAICNDWVFEVGYEFRFAANMFEGWADPTTAFSAQDGLTFVDLGAAHVSPPKIGGSLDAIIVACDPSFGNGCDAGGGPLPPAQDVPEPATGALLGLGLAALGLARRRRRNPLS